MKLLLVDCDIHHLRLMHKIFENEFDEVLEAFDGAEGYEKFKAHSPDVIVSEVMLPSMNGWEMAKAIRRKENIKQPTIVFCTGIGPKLNEMTSPNFGADGYLDKPYRKGILLETVQRAIVKRREENDESEAVHP